MISSTCHFFQIHVVSLKVNCQNEITNPLNSVTFLQFPVVAGFHYCTSDSYLVPLCLYAAEFKFRGTHLSNEQILYFLQSAGQ